MAEIYVHKLGTVSDEQEAANALKHILLEEVEDIPGKIWIVPSVNIHPATGRHDIDLLLIGFLRNYTLDEVLGNTCISFKSFFTTIEVKSHKPEGLHPEGTHVRVDYPDMPNGEDVTQQSEDQKESVRKFLNGPMSGMAKPFVTNLIWLRGTTKDDFDSHVGLKNSNVLCSDSTAVDFFEAIARQNRLRDYGYVNAFAKDLTTKDIEWVADIFCAKRNGVDTMSLRRMALLNKGEDVLEKFDFENKPLIVLSGHAGTGKTLMLLKAANNLVRRGHKCLFLTYNTALISDLKHTIDFLDSNSRLEMKSMHSFLIGVLAKTGIWKNTYTIESDFSQSLSSFLLKKEHLQIHFDYEFVFVDEAQDWRQNEAEVLKYLCGINSSHIVIADGVDQFMYTSEHTDWGESTLPKLKTCLRQRSNLVTFAKLFASKLGIYWDVQSSRKLPGGRVLVSYGYDPELHKLLFTDAKNHGCTAYDIMLLAPRSLVNNGKFALIETYRNFGINVFDGIDKNNRDKLYGTQNSLNEECRVYTYESCRGLEAWTTICLRFDQLFSLDLDHVHPHSYIDIKYEPARKYMLGLWTLISLTRAVDTLVLCVTEGSFVDKIIKDISKEAPDFVSYWKASR